MADIAQTVAQIAVSHEDKTVWIELICRDELGACVLYDDVLSRMNSPEGMRLFVKCRDQVVEEGAP